MIPEYMDKKHDYSFTRDRQLQNKLLAADDIFDLPKQTTYSTSSASGLRPSNLKDSKFCEVTGWCPDDKLVLRRPEHDTALSKPRTSVGGRECHLTRDRSKKDLHDSSYAFYHYPETHRYIEQYRREHTCTDSTNSATTRNEFLELQRFYAYRSQTGSLYTHPTTVGYMPQPQTPTRREHTNTLQHRNSESNLRSASRYKLSPSLNVRSEPELSKESDQADSPLQVGANAAGSTSKMTIHAVTKTPIPKVPAKVTVPANQAVLSAGLNKTVKAGRMTGSPKASATAWENNVGAVRTLDTLTCVARPGEKPEEIHTSRSSPLPELVKSPRVQEERPDSMGGTPRLRSDSETSEVANASFDRLSTTCLAADVCLKPRPRLEPSCTYHVFPSEDMLVDAPTLFTSSMLWNPAKSTLDRRSSQLLQFDPGLNNPFRNNVVTHSPMKMPDKEQMVKEFINDLKPLNLSVNTADVARLETPARGLRGSSTKPDLPSSFELQGVSHTGRPVTHQEPRVRKGRGKLRHRDGERKAQSAHSTSTETETSTSSRSLRLKPQERESQEGSVGEGAPSQQPSVPYFKFWNSSLPSRFKGDVQAKRDSPPNGEMNLRKIAELMLNNEELPEGELKELIQRRANTSPANANAAPSIASGVSEGPAGCSVQVAGNMAVTVTQPATDTSAAVHSIPLGEGKACESHTPVESPALLSSSSHLHTPTKPAVPVLQSEHASPALASTNTCPHSTCQLISQRSTPTVSVSREPRTDHSALLHCNPSTISPSPSCSGHRGGDAAQATDSTREQSNRLQGTKGEDSARQQGAKDEDSVARSVLSDGALAGVTVSCITACLQSPAQGSALGERKLTLWDTGSLCSMQWGKAGEAVSDPVQLKVKGREEMKVKGRQGVKVKGRQVVKVKGRQMVKGNTEDREWTVGSSTDSFGSNVDSQADHSGDSQADSTSVQTDASSSVADTNTHHHQDIMTMGPESCSLRPQGGGGGVEGPDTDPKDNPGHQETVSNTEQRVHQCSLNPCSKLGLSVTCQPDTCDPPGVYKDTGHIRCKDIISRSVENVLPNRQTGQLLGVSGEQQDAVCHPGGDWSASQQSSAVFTEGHTCHDKEPSAQNRSGLSHDGAQQEPSSHDTQHGPCHEDRPVSYPGHGDRFTAQNKMCVFQGKAGPATDGSGDHTLTSSRPMSYPRTSSHHTDQKRSSAALSQSQITLRAYQSLKKAEKPDSSRRIAAQCGISGSRNSGKLCSPRTSQKSSFGTRRRFTPQLLFSARPLHTQSSSRSEASRSQHSCSREPVNREQHTKNSHHHQDHRPTPGSRGQHQLLMSNTKQGDNSTPQLKLLTPANIERDSLNNDSLNSVCSVVTNHRPSSERDALNSVCSVATYRRPSSERDTLNSVCSVVTCQRPSSARSNSCSRAVRTTKHRAAGVPERGSGSVVVTSTPRSQSHSFVRKSSSWTRRLCGSSTTPPQGSPLLLCHDDVGEMMVVGSDCVQRPSTTPSPLTTRSIEVRHLAAPQVMKPAVKWRDSRQSVRVLLQPSSLCAGPLKDRAESTVTVSNTGQGQRIASTDRHTDRVWQDRTKSTVTVSGTGQGQRIASTDRHTDRVWQDRTKSTVTVSNTGQGQGSVNTHKHTDRAWVGGRMGVFGKNCTSRSGCDWDMQG